MMKHVKAMAAGAVIALGATGAGAATLLDIPAATGALPTDTSVTDVFKAAAGPGDASFIIDGYLSLDGQNYYEDDFGLSLNGKSILTGTFNLGGGGDNVVYTQPLGSTVTNISGNGTNVTFAGGQVVVDTPVSLVDGTNLLTFSYTSLAGPDHAGFQGLGDEGWGVRQIQVTGAAQVPEPATWAMMLVGFAGLGAALRMRRARLAAA